LGSRVYHAYRLLTAMMRLRGYFQRRGRGKKRVAPSDAFHQLVPSPVAASVACQAGASSETSDTNHDNFNENDIYGAETTQSTPNAWSHYEVSPESSESLEPPAPGGDEAPPTLVMLRHAETPDTIEGAATRDDRASFRKGALGTDPPRISRTLRRQTSEESVPDFLNSESSNVESMDETFARVFKKPPNFLVLSRYKREGRTVTRILDIAAPSAVRDFQGAWEQVRRRGEGRVKPWLRTFVITGPTFSRGNGGVEYLTQSVCGGQVLLCGGLLQMEPADEEGRAGGDHHKEGRTSEERLLTWTSLLGETFRFRRIVLPPIDDVKKFEGNWPLIVDGQVMRDKPSLQIRGRRWTQGNIGGFLKLQDGLVKLDVYTLVQTTDPQGNADLHLSQNWGEERRRASSGPQPSDAV